LHPALKTSLYKNGQAAVVNATCVPLRNRSHFDAQDNLETGLPGKPGSNQTGWLNCLLSALPAGAPVGIQGCLAGSPRRAHDLAQYDHLPGECGHVAAVQSDQERHGFGLGESPSPGSDKKRCADRALPGKAGIADGRKRITPGDATSGLSEM
jgi:hypothetical protein